MKFIVAIAATLAMFGVASNSASTTDQVAAPELCLNILTETWGGCGAVNAGLPSNGYHGGGSKLMMMMTRATI